MLGRLMQPVEECFLSGLRDVIDFASRAVRLRFSLDRRQAGLGQLFEVSIEMTLADMPDSSEFALELLVKFVRVLRAWHEEAEQNRLRRDRQVFWHDVIYAKIVNTFIVNNRPYYNLMVIPVKQAKVKSADGGLTRSFVVHRGHCRESKRKAAVGFIMLIGWTIMDRRICA